MSGGILLELELFARSFLCGMFLALLYDLLRLFRRLVRHGNFALAVEDLLYWLACALLVFLLCLQLEIFLKKIRKKLHNSVKRGIMTSKSTQEGGKKP